ncbi:MAG TPA: NADH-quinone oxidoreductase subunit M [Verrucomicrobiota bacterium]|nr:NADH-quinone oxidoreductase subunit M [Verrucomicrobiota bacterium]HNU51834.1 NADH-quinone oxidoreductase subunit M [Verrucomicrobiota bacterium]
MDTLSFIVLCPAAGAAAIALTPRRFQFLFRLIALGTTLFSLLGALALFAGFEPGTARIQFEEYMPWVDSVGIGFHLGADGLNLGLIVMAALVGFAAAAASREITDRQKEYYLLLLVMICGVLGTFASLDLFFFYFFHELALVPTFLMMGIWGRGERRAYATFKITIYLSLGALLVLLGLIGLYVVSDAKTFDVVELGRHLAAHPLSESAQATLFPLLLFGFGILVSLWPFHTWAPIAYDTAPTATAMLHAGVLKKFGLYGLLRVAVPMLPAAARDWIGVLAVLCLGNLLYCGLVAMRQRNLTLLLGNSSVAHMGFVFLGIASLTLVGITGAVVVMVAHGLLAALSFGLAGFLRERLGTVEFDNLGGLLQRMPFVGTALALALLAGCGLPGFANFPGEMLVLFGAWKAHPVVVSLAAWAGLVVGAVYALRAVRRLLHGPLPARWAGLTDLAGAWPKTPFALLLAALILLGCFPRLLTERIQATTLDIIHAVHGPSLAESPATPNNPQTQPLQSSSSVAPAMTPMLLQKPPPTDARAQQEDS